MCSIFNKKVSVCINKVNINTLDGKITENILQQILWFLD